MRLEVTNVMGYSGPSDDYSMLDQSLEMKRWSWKLAVFSKCSWWVFSSLLDEGFISATARFMVGRSLNVEPLSFSLSLSPITLSFSPLCPCTSIYVFLVLTLYMRCIEADWSIFPDRLCGASEFSDRLDCCFVSMLNYWNHCCCFPGV